MPALLEACRPLNALLASLAVLLGAVLVAGPSALAGAAPWFALLATLASLAAGNLLNDLADQAEDRLNRPGRPLVSGRLRPATARRAAWVLMALGLLAGAAPGLASAGMVLACQAALVWYARRGKTAGLAGNGVVGALGAAAVLLGALVAGGSPIPALVPAALAGILHTMREVVKDIQDRHGDQRAGRRSWVLRHPPGHWRPLLLMLAGAGLAVVLPAAALFPRGQLAAAHGLASLVALWTLLRVALGVRPLEDPLVAGRFSAELKRLLALGLLIYGLAACLS